MPSNPLPEGCAGWRLCHKVMGLEASEYLAHYRRSNLCEGAWDLAEARDNARAIYKMAECPVVLLGAKVARAFQVDYVPFKVMNIGSLEGKALPQQLVWLVVLPHPSGRCRTWNARVAFDKARAALKSVGAL